MGLSMNSDIEVLIKGKRGYQEFDGKSILMLGKQVANFNIGQLYEVIKRSGFEYKKSVIDIADYDIRERKIDSYDLYKLIGFSDVHALDISDYEGADIIMDLSTKELPDNLSNKFDYIHNGGTLEHVYDVISAMTNICRMLKTGGTVIHSVPCNGWVDHGFYSFNPTNFIDFYSENGFFINQSFLFGYQCPDDGTTPIISPDCRFVDCDKWVRENGRKFRINLICVAEKDYDVEEFKMSFTQYHWAESFKKEDLTRVRYDYTSRLKRIRELCHDINGTRIAVYGSKLAAKTFINDMRNLGIDNTIVGIYDREFDVGTIWKYGNVELPVLDIHKTREDAINVVFCAGGSNQTIDLIRERIANVKKQGIVLV